MTTINNGINNAADNDLFINSLDNDGSAHILNMRKSRAGGVITSGDSLGGVYFSGFDGTNFIAAAKIISTSSGTIGAARVAGNLQFLTHPDSNSAALNRMTIDTTGAITIPAPDSGNTLTLSALGNGVMLTSSTGVVSSLNTGAANTVLVSSGVGSVPTWAAVPATAGVTAIAGTAFQWAVSAATGSVVGSLPVVVVAPGSLASTSTLAAGNLTTAGIVQNSVTTGILTSYQATNHTIQLGNSSSQLNSFTVGTAGQILTSGGAADPAWVTVLPIANGGTNTATTPGTNAVLYFDGTKYVGLTNGTTGQILTATTASAPSWGAAPASGIITLAGDSGSATGATVTVAGAPRVVTTSGSGSTLTLATPSIYIGAAGGGSGQSNTFVGRIAGNSAVNTTFSCTAVGDQAMAGLTTAGGNGSNSAFGASSMFALTIGYNNSAFGYQTLSANTSGHENDAFGVNALISLATGSRNTVFGTGAGQNYTTSESNNVILGQTHGTIGESNVMRLGHDGSGAATATTKAFMTGVYNIAVGATAGVNITDSTGQIGTISGTASQMLIGGTKPAWSNISSGAVVSVSGTTNQITSSNSGVGSTTLSIPSVFIAPGSIDSSTTLTAGTLLKMVTTTSTAGQLQINGIRVLHAFGTGNIFIGPPTANPSGNFTLTTGSAISNTGIGDLTLAQLTTGQRNTAFGAGALFHCTTGSRNATNGFNCLDSLTTGNYNTAVGSNGLSSLVSGSNNICIGTDDGSGTGWSGQNYTTSESNNILVGSAGVAADANIIRIGTSGSGTGQQNKCFIAAVYNIAVGATAGVAIVDSTDQHGTISGTASQMLIGGTKPAWSNISSNAVTSVNGTTNQISSSNIGAGSTTLSLPSTIIAPGSIEATTSIKADTIFNTPTTSSSVGQYQINGTAVLQTFGTNNTFVGAGAGSLTTTGTNSVCVGALAGNALSTSANNNNTYKGYKAGTVDVGTSGNDGGNVGVGKEALAAFTGATDAQNTAIGTQSLDVITTGKRNTCLGWEAGHALTTNDSDNILIGWSVVSAGGTNNLLKIGGGTGTGSGQQNVCRISGITGITVTGTAVLISGTDQLGIAVSSKRYKENIANMADYSSDIYKLRPVTFTYKVGDDKSQQSGLIAEEVAEVMPALVVNDPEGLPQSVKYHDLPALLLNEIQKLEARIRHLEARL